MKLHEISIHFVQCMTSGIKVNQRVNGLSLSLLLILASFSAVRVSFWFSIRHQAIFEIEMNNQFFNDGHGCNLANSFIGCVYLILLDKIGS